MSIIPLISWFVAQSIKVIIVLVTEKRINFKKFIEAGGMPSSHSAMVVSLATVICKNYGFNSSDFAIAMVFALIVMYDASGVRRAVGKQAVVLNKLNEEFFSKTFNVNDQLKELLGHTHVEVISGAALGIIVGLLC